VALQNLAILLYAALQLFTKLQFSSPQDWVPACIRLIATFKLNAGSEPVDRGESSCFVLLG
jgi:hypothetical protein